MSIALLFGTYLLGTKYRSQFAKLDTKYGAGKSLPHKQNLTTAMKDMENRFLDPYTRSGKRNRYSTAMQKDIDALKPKKVAPLPTKAKRKSSRPSGSSSKTGASVLKRPKASKGMRAAALLNNKQKKENTLG
jgi:hypothetical protein